MKIALVGIGKITLDQHVPALADSPVWELAATVSSSGTVPGVPAFTGIDAMLAECSDIGAVIMQEYPALYARMADLVRRRASEVDPAPMVLVADAFTRDRRHAVDPFDF